MIYHRLRAVFVVAQNIYAATAMYDVLVTLFSSRKQRSIRLRQFKPIKLGHSAYIVLNIACGSPQGDTTVLPDVSSD